MTRWGSWSSFLLFFVFLPSVCFAGAEPALDLDTLRVRVRLHAAGEICLNAGGAVSVASPEGTKELPPGAYTVKAESVSAPSLAYRLFVKTFQPAEEAKARAFMADWKGRGYAPEMLVFGKKFAAPSGAIIDNRSLWVSVGRADSARKADALKEHLAKEEVWAWVVPERIGQGAGVLTVASGGKTVLRARAPLTFRSAGPLEAPGIDRGFWNPRHETLRFSGALEIAPDPDGQLELVEVIPVEAYVAGVLPAEMPASWPVEALKAQAIAARTEVFAALGGKHMLEGFDFCATEHCRAYGGAGAREDASDKAVSTTAGHVLVRDGKFVAAVFSANCGGRTENNEAVWSAPPNPALRSVSDAKQAGRPGWEERGMTVWLKQPAPAWCDHRSDSFRWTRRFSVKELSDIVNKRHGVGRVRAIELLERGPGGRLRAVKIIGSSGSAVVKKELTIRLAFGGLPSAMFIVETARGADGPTAFSFIGGGRGHGVGLCQDGACGMAKAGKSSQEILRHYFTGVDLIRLR